MAESEFGKNGLESGHESNFGLQYYSKKHSLISSAYRRRTGCKFLTMYSTVCDILSTRFPSTTSKSYNIYSVRL